MDSTDVSNETLELGVPCQEKFGSLSGQMIGINNVFIFPYKKVAKTEEATSESHNCSVNVNLMQKTSWLYGRFQRKLINESLDTFLSIQKAADDPNKDFKTFLAKKSKDYRSMIQACVSEMTQVSRETKSRDTSLVSRHRKTFQGLDSDKLDTDCQLLYKMELILGLAEIVFIQDTSPAGSLVSSLLTWVRLHLPLPRQRLREALAADQPALYPKYWEAIYGLVLQGLLDEARELLSHHPNSNSDSFLSMDELLRKMPFYSSYSGLPESELRARWHHWNNECQTRLRNGEYQSSKQLQTVCNILINDSATLSHLSDVIDTWYHVMTSRLLFSAPWAATHRLPAAAHEAIRIFWGKDNEGSLPEMGPLDRILLAVLEADDLAVLNGCQRVVDNLWFTCHMCDILWHALKEHRSNKYLKKLRENLLLDYGCELVAHKSLWQVGLYYLNGGGKVSYDEDNEKQFDKQIQANSAISSLVLERIPISSDHKAFKLIHSATTRGLDHVALGVCRVLGGRRLRSSQVGAAVWWAVRSQDAAFTAHLAHKILRRYMEDGSFLSSSLLDHLGPAMLLSDTLTFLGKYREFHTLYQAGRLSEAAQLLVSLMSSGLAPEYFWPVLLHDATPLLNIDPPVIDADQNLQLMYCLQNVTLSQHDSDEEKKKKNSLHSSLLSKESDLRLSLTENLARAIIAQGTTQYN